MKTSNRKVAPPRALLLVAVVLVACAGIVTPAAAPPLVGRTSPSPSRIAPELPHDFQKPRGLEMPRAYEELLRPAPKDEGAILHWPKDESATPRPPGRNFDDTLTPNVKKDSAPKLKTNRSSQPQQNVWKTWHDMPAQVPGSGIKLQKGAAAALAPEDYPGIRLKKPESTGPPFSFDLFEKTKGVPYDKAVRAFLIGPDSRIIAKYSKSPDGRYLLDLPPGTDFPAGRYQVRLVIDGSEAQVIRSISFRSEPSGPHGNTASPENIKVYVSKEALEGKLPRTTFDTDLAGEKFFKSGMDQIDRAVVQYKENYEGLDHRSSYDLRWKTTLKYARALHDAVLWYRYDSVADARMLFEKLLEEYKLSSSKWFWQLKLPDIGIKESDITEPLRDLQALELQKLYVDYSLNGEPANLGKLTSSLSSFTDRFLSDEAALSTRLTVDRSELISDLARLKGALQKLERPVLVDLDDGDFLVANIALDKGDQIRTILDPLDTALHKSDRLSAK